MCVPSKSSLTTPKKRGCVSYDFSEFCIYGNDDFGNNHDKGTLFLIWDRFWITISTKRWRFATPWSFLSLSEGKLVKQLSIWAFWCLFQLFFSSFYLQHDKTKLLKYDVVLDFFIKLVDQLKMILSSKKKERLTDDFCIISFLITPILSCYITFNYIFVMIFFSHGCHEFLCMQARNPFEFLNQKYQPFREKVFISITLFFTLKDSCHI